MKARGQVSSNGLPVRVLDLRGTYKGGGGPDKTILNSAVLHDRQRVDVLVCYLKQPQDTEFQIAGQAARLEIRYQDLVDRHFLDLQCVRELERLVRRERIEVVHTHDDKTSLYGYLLKRRIPRLTLMHTCHSHAEYGREHFPSFPAYLSFLLRKKIIIQLLKRHAKPVLTISENTKTRLVRGGLSGQDVAVLYNGIDTSFWSRQSVTPVLRRELDIDAPHLLVGTVARITYDKDLPTFYEVARRVQERLPAVHFVIVGDGYGNELAEARQQVDGLGLNGLITFTGHRQDLKEVYSSFDLFLMTSRTEGLPNTVLEAMAMEVPVVATNVGGVPELVQDQVTGLLAGVGDVASLSGAVLDLLQDSNRRQAYAAAGRLRITQSFDFLQRVRAMEDFYAQFTCCR